MALRNGRVAGLRRVASRRAGFVALAAALYLAAGIAATWPAVLHARSHFLSGGAPGHGEASPGDHLQTLYHYWLVGHQLEHGHAPWRDPYTFQPEAKQQANYAGWPFGFVFWPLGALFGLVAGWNLLQLVVYALAGLFACAWLRELGLPRSPAASSSRLRRTVCSRASVTCSVRSRSCCRSRSGHSSAAGSGCMPRHSH